MHYDMANVTRKLRSHLINMKVNSWSPSVESFCLEIKEAFQVEACVPDDRTVEFSILLDLSNDHSKIVII